MFTYITMNIFDYNIKSTPVTPDESNWKRRVRVRVTAGAYPITQPGLNIMGLEWVVSWFEWPYLSSRCWGGGGIGWNRTWPQRSRTILSWQYPTWWQQAGVCEVSLPDLVTAENQAGIALFTATLLAIGTHQAVCTGGPRSGLERGTGARGGLEGTWE